MKAMTGTVPVSRPLPINLPNPLPSPPSSHLHPLTSPPHHPLPTATEFSATNQSGEEEEDDGVNRAHPPTPTASQTRGSVENSNIPKSDSEQKDTTEGGQVVIEPSSATLPRDNQARGENSLPPAHQSPHTREISEERAEEVRNEVVASLYRRYLKELRATQRPGKKTGPSPAVRGRERHTQSQWREEQRQHQLRTKHGRKLEDTRKSVKEEEGREERQPPPGNLCVLKISSVDSNLLFSSWSDL